MTEINKIIVTGAKGQLGQAILAEIPDTIGLSSSDLDITQEDQISRIVAQHQPSMIINCAAFTNVELAEEEKEKATLINATSVGHLAEACKAQNIPFIHFSTDYVFDGYGVALEEEDQTNPLNHYGMSKLKGENLALEENHQTWIFRLSWLYSNGHHNFKNTIIKKGNGPTLTIVDDQISCPTYAVQFAKDLKTIVSKILNETVPPGVYHYSHQGQTSWYGFAREIKNIYQLKSEITPVKSHQFKTKAKRPSYSKLNGALLTKTFGLESIHWKEALLACHQKDIEHGQ